MKRILEDSTKTFKDFCDSTSLHGYSYFSNATSITLKLFWIIVILGMTTGSIFLLMENTFNYLNSGILTSFQSSSAPLDVSGSLSIYCANCDSILAHLIVVTITHTSCLSLDKYFVGSSPVIARKVIYYN